MSISDAQYLAWLKSDTAYRCILVELAANVSGTETTYYLSSKPYVSQGSDTPANKKYLAVVSGGMQFTEDMGVGGSATMSYGDIELDNTNGEWDAAFGWVWHNRRVTVGIGDVSWARADFRIILDGIIDDIGSSAQNRITIKVRDKLQRLNNPLSETLLGGTTANAKQIIPMTLGECFNVSPLLTNPTTYEYQVHPLPIEDIIEVRDNGMPVPITKNLSTGKFTLNNGKPTGAITCSVQGHKQGGTTYINTVASLIKECVKVGGTSFTQFVDADIDLTNFFTFDAAHAESIGYYVNSRENIITIIQGIADSIGAKCVMSRAGKLRLFQVAMPSGGGTKTITPADMEAKSFRMAQRLPIVPGMAIGYCKNWTVQSDLKTFIPPDHKDFFAKDVVRVAANNSVAATLYKDNTTPQITETYLINDSDAANESTRRLALQTTGRALYEFNGLASCINLELGDQITLTHPRFGFAAGKNAMVTKLAIDWFKARVTVQVLA